MWVHIAVANFLFFFPFYLSHYRVRKADGKYTFVWKSFCQLVRWIQEFPETKMCVCMKGRLFLPLLLPPLWTTLVKSEDELMSSAWSLRMTTHQAPYGCRLTTACIHWWLPDWKPRFAWRFLPRPWNLNKHPENVLFVKQQRANKGDTRAVVCSYSTGHFPFGRIYAFLFSPFK